MRCELHRQGPLANQCQAEAALTVQVVTGVGPERTAQFTASACVDDSFEAIVVAVQLAAWLEIHGSESPQIELSVEELGARYVSAVIGHQTVRARWPLSHPGRTVR